MNGHAGSGFGSCSWRVTVAKVSSFVALSIVAGVFSNSMLEIGVKAPIRYFSEISSFSLRGAAFNDSHKVDRGPSAATALIVVVGDIQS